MNLTSRINQSGRTALVLFVIVSMLALPLYASAQTSTGELQTRFAIDGALYTSPPGEPAPYLNEDGRTMVPASFFAAALGVPPQGIQWDADTKTATISHEGQVLQLTLGQPYLLVNGAQQPIDTTIAIRDGRIFIPVRFIAEGLGVQTAWDTHSRIVHLSTDGPALSPAEARDVIADQADEVMQLISELDLDGLADHVHPERGLRFSPYSYVDVEEHVVLYADELASNLINPELREWGFFDGSGETILLDFEDYWLRFVYSHDFRQAPEVSYNEQLFSGNMINNAPTVYGGSIIVEYHFDGIDEQYAGMDWRSLRLVFQPYGEEWRLTGIINDEWTT
ncbi:copper amine oxidase N-terminal domain-containing protein [Paenibacillus sp. 1P07SE]|uniref:copper amine oxidase N-terminal domain-containing protein n=1 Tax=Paenibacillus sp. 1P07SE TaxID=3132209 RepID=UPI0039A6A529